jgi:hypothetical protein
MGCLLLAWEEAVYSVIYCVKSSGEVTQPMLRRQDGRMIRTVDVVNLNLLIPTSPQVSLRDFQSFGMDIGILAHCCN